MPDALRKYLKKLKYSEGYVRTSTRQIFAIETFAICDTILLSHLGGDTIFMGKIDFDIRLLIFACAVIVSLSVGAFAKEHVADRVADCLGRLVVNSYVQYEQEAISKQQLYDVYYALAKYIMQSYLEQIVARNDFDLDKVSERAAKMIRSEFALYDRQLLEQSDRDAIASCQATLLKALSKIPDAEILEKLSEKGVLDGMHKIADEMYKDVSKFRE